MFILKLNENKYLDNTASITDCHTTNLQSKMKIFDYCDTFNLIRFVRELKNRNMIKVDEYIFRVDDCKYIHEHCDKLQKDVEDFLLHGKEDIAIVKVDNEFYIKSINMAGVITGYTKIKRDALLINVLFASLISKNTAINMIENKRVSIDVLDFDRGTLKEFGVDKYINKLSKFHNLLGGKI